jgi:hypothetical protein
MAPSGGEAAARIVAVDQATPGVEHQQAAVPAEGQIGDFVGPWPTARGAEGGERLAGRIELEQAPVRFQHVGQTGRVEGHPARLAQAGNRPEAGQWAGLQGAGDAKLGGAFGRPGGRAVAVANLKPFGDAQAGPAGPRLGQLELLPGRELG